jgi:hypothetical protein
MARLPTVVVSRRQPYARMTARSARGNDLRAEPPQLNNPTNHQHHVGAQGHLLVPVAKRPLGAV